MSRILLYHKDLLKENNSIFNSCMKFWNKVRNITGNEKKKQSSKWSAYKNTIFKYIYYWMSWEIVFPWIIMPINFGESKLRLY